MSKDPVLEQQMEAVLDWHLTGNLYPPASSIPNYLEFAKTAIKLVSAGTPDETVTVLVDNNEGVLMNRKTNSPVTAGEIVESWRLHDFCGSEQIEGSDATEPSKLGNNYNN